MDRSASPAANRSATPPYRRIVAELRRRIDAGELSPGDRVPSTRRITQEWGVAMATATKVLTTLRQEGLVRAVPGVGTVVADPGASAAGDPAPRPRGNIGSGGGRHALPPGDDQAAGRPPSLSRDRIVRAGVRIADAEGLRSLSMRRVAAEFGASSMALYRHVANKDELVMLMADATFAEIELPDPAPRHWRARMEAGARLQWQLYQRHPWVAQWLSITRPQPMPHAMILIEWTMGAATRFDPLTKLRLALTLLNHVRGTAVALEEDLEAEQQTGMDQEQWMASLEPEYERILESGAFPMYAGIGDEDDAGTLRLDAMFEFGLARLLDGFEVFNDGWTGRPAP
ncbi:GntR family transcriptional regulator [Streptomyces paromomycinus]|uniref:GntR family transcriptional regulator n=1 Tax=Streptomyces paromomycinus TaxID=92743 RepID=A0A401W9Q2_STREY|nr:GntR family transcriptional regulator [Streptomyces paromomycinus]GCD46038.1 GntR family transcriptional regulator [Streptomyces paromomycinus]